MSPATTDDILAAIDRDELELHYQPQVAARTRAVMAAEALIRWRHPAHGLLGAGSVVPVIEAAPDDALAHLTRWALLRACHDNASLSGGTLAVAVNVSARDLTRERFAEDVVRALLLSGLPAHLLEIEITETQPLDDTPGVRDNLALLRDLGVALAIDDYGTGHATTASLDLVEPDTLKIPHELTRGITAGRERPVLDALRLADERMIDVVAEGVETEAEYAWLVEQGVATIQGYLIGRPMPLGQYRTFLNDHRWPEALSA